MSLLLVVLECRQIEFTGVAVVFFSKLRNVVAKGSVELLHFEMIILKTFLVGKVCHLDFTWGVASILVSTVPAEDEGVRVVTGT